MLLKKWKCQLLSHVQLFATPTLTPWTVAYQGPLFMKFSKQEYWSGWPFPSPGDLPEPENEPGSPTLQSDSLLSEPLEKPLENLRHMQFNLWFLHQYDHWQPTLSTTLIRLQSKISFIITVILCSWVFFPVATAVEWTPTILSLCFPQENFHCWAILRQEYLTILVSFLYLFFLIISPQRSDYGLINWQNVPVFCYALFLWTGIKGDSCFVVLFSFLL